MTCFLFTDFMRCSQDVYAPVIAYVSKMFPIDVDILPQNKVRFVEELTLDLTFLSNFDLCFFDVLTLYP